MAEIESLTPNEIRNKQTGYYLIVKSEIRNIGKTIIYTTCTTDYIGIQSSIKTNYITILCQIITTSQATYIR